MIRPFLVLISTVPFLCFLVWVFCGSLHWYSWSDTSTRKSQILTNNKAIMRRCLILLKCQQHTFSFWGTALVLVLFVQDDFYTGGICGIIPMLVALMGVQKMIQISHKKQSAGVKSGLLGDHCMSPLPRIFVRKILMKKNPCSICIYKYFAINFFTRNKTPIDFFVL